MVKKVLGALVVIAAVSVYLTIREEGKDKAFGGVLSPIETVRGGDDSLGPDAPLGSLVTGQSIPQTAQSNYGQLVDRVRTRTNDAMDKSRERSSSSLRR
jgi:hypothetical protein